VIGCGQPHPLTSTFTTKLYTLFCSHLLDLFWSILSCRGGHEYSLVLKTPEFHYKVDWLILLVLGKVASIVQACSHEIRWPLTTCGYLNKISKTCEPVLKFD
jgi:hypothetical protein